MRRAALALCESFIKLVDDNVVSLAAALKTVSHPAGCCCASCSMLTALSGRFVQVLRERLHVLADDMRRAERQLFVKTSTPHHKSSTPNPKPQTPKPKPQTPHPKPQNPQNPKPKTLSSTSGGKGSQGRRGRGDAIRRYRQVATPPTLSPEP